MFRIVREVLMQRACVEVIATAALSAFPREACGLLIGTMRGASARVTAVAVTRNISASPRGFAIAPGEHDAVAAGLDGRQRILGSFHSHHDSAEPSGWDWENMWRHGLVSVIAGGSATGVASAVTLAGFQVDRAGTLLRLPIGYE